MCSIEVLFVHCIALYMLCYIWWEGQISRGIYRYGQRLAALVTWMYDNIIAAVKKKKPGGEDRSIGAGSGGGTGEYT